MIQEGELRRIGENVSRRVDVRIVAATNRLLRRGSRGRTLPAAICCTGWTSSASRAAAPRAAAKTSRCWPNGFWRDATERVGSRAAAERGHACGAGALRLAGERPRAAERAGGPRRRAGRSAASCRRRRCHPLFGGRRDDESWRLDAARRVFDERFVRAALVRAGGHRGRAAEELGVSRQGLTKLMTRLGIESDGPTSPSSGNNV